MYNEIDELERPTISWSTSSSLFHVRTLVIEQYAVAMHASFVNPHPGCHAFFDFDPSRPPFAGGGRMTFAPFKPPPLHKICAWHGFHRSLWQKQPKT